MSVLYDLYIPRIIGSTLLINHVIGTLGYAETCDDEGNSIGGKLDCISCRFDQLFCMKDITSCLISISVLIIAWTVNCSRWLAVHHLWIKLFVHCILDVLVIIIDQAVSYCRR